MTDLIPRDPMSGLSIVRVSRDTHIPNVGIVHGNDPFDWFGVWLPDVPEPTTTPEHAARKWLDTTEGGKTRQDIASGGSMTEGLIKAFQAGATWRGEKEGK